MHDLDQNGFVLIPAVIAKPQIASMIDNLTALESHRAIREKSGATYAVRRLCELSPAVRQLSTSAAIRALIEPILGPAARVVRGLLFDKTAAANWKVPWHQDLTIAVKERRDAPGFGPWSIKADITHVHHSMCSNKCSRFVSTSTTAAPTMAPCASCLARTKGA
jgi:hypothetical protein